MDEMRKRMDDQDLVIMGIRGDTLVQASALQGVQKDLGVIGKDVTSVLAILGKEEEDGAGNYLGTGLLGRVRRVERSQRSLRELYHRWIAFGSGFVFCGGAALAILWWLLGDKLAIVLKVH